MLTDRDRKQLEYMFLNYIYKYNMNNNIDTFLCFLLIRGFLDTDNIIKELDKFEER